MSEPIPEAEAYIQFRLDGLASRNEHHRFEEIAVRIARRRISANILLATGPVSAGGDQGRDGESYTTHIPDELPFAAGFSASASTEPVVVACTIQQTALRRKVLADVDAICAPGADPVTHIAYFSVHPIPSGTVHELKAAVRDAHAVTLDVYSGPQLAMLLAEPELVWVARAYLDLPTSMIPPPDDEPAPGWYVELLDALRRNGGPAALTPATQGEVTAGLRHATWDEDTNADLPEWIEFMAAFLADARDGQDTEMVFRACYEIFVARVRGTGDINGAEDLVRRALAFARTSGDPNIVDDAVTLVAYWGPTVAMGAGHADAHEVGEAMVGMRDHAADLLAATDAATHPVRAASLNGTLALLHLHPDWRQARRRRRPAAGDVARLARTRPDGADIDVSGLSADEMVDAHAAMGYLDALVDLLPRAHAYPVTPIATVFDVLAPVLADYPAYAKVRDGLDARTAEVEGDTARASRCRDRGAAFVKAGKPLAALTEMHNAKRNWFNGETLYGTVLSMRFIAHLYADLGLTYAAKMYACAAAAIAVSQGEDDLREQVPSAFLEAAGYAQRTGCWADGAALTEIALLARTAYMPDPFDLDRHPDLSAHHTSSLLELSLIRALWPDLEPLITAAYARTPDWYADLSETIELAGENPMTTEQFATAASEQLDGPVFADVGPRRVIDFAALGVRWSFTFPNDRASVLPSESLVAAFQVLLADVAPFEPVVLSGTVHVIVDVDAGSRAAGRVGVIVDDTGVEPTAYVTLDGDDPAGDHHHRELIAACFQMLAAAVARPEPELYALMDPLFAAGLMHKLFAGRPYEEVADLFDDEHYARCAAATRPEVSARFVPASSPALAAATTTGPGYDHDRSLRLIGERYEVAEQSLAYTLPRVLADPASRAVLVDLRAAGWLDWQILVALLNVAWNWRLAHAGLRIGVDAPAAVQALARAPETEASPTMPLAVFSSDEIAMHIYGQTISIARTWDLHGWSRVFDEGALRDLLVRRYHYAEDDVAHRDLLGDDLVVDGVLQPFLLTSE